MRLPDKPSRIALIIGTPAATAASKATITPLSNASAKISLPYCAISALFAVTTCLPEDKASNTNSRAGREPPINSTITSSESSRTTSKGSSQTSMSPRSTGRFLLASRTATLATSMPHPARRLISSALRHSTSNVLHPTVPKPSMPTLTGFICLEFPIPASPHIENHTLWPLRGSQNTAEHPTTKPLYRSLRRRQIFSGTTAPKLTPNNTAASAPPIPPARPIRKN